MSTTRQPSPSTQPEPSHDILRRSTRHPLTSIFAPRSVALIGATETPSSVGRTILENLTAQTFGGAVYPVNPKRDAVLGIKAYPNVASLPECPDLAVICTPSLSVPGLIGQCVAAGVKGAVIISAGFKETGAPGIALEQEILQIARGKMRIIGPNCLGVMAPKRGLNATFAADMAQPGSVGFLSQSGALCTAILDWSLRENVGFSAFASLGSMLDVGWGDLIYYLGDDPDTKSIVIYMESIGDARSFLSAAREVALTKPIIVIKVGRTEQAAKAAASHTGSLTGSDEVLDAAFRRAGVLRVNSISELFAMADVLAKQPHPAGPRLAIVTNAGGPGALATDMLVSTGGQLAELSAESLAAYNEMLPAHWSHNNPVDVLGDAGAKRYAEAVEIVAKDPNNDGILVILTPQAMTEATATAELLKPFAHIEGKPVLASWMGGADVAAGEEVLNKANIPAFNYPDSAAKAFSYMWRYSYNLRGIYETPALVDDLAKSKAGREEARRILLEARSQGQTLLNEFDSKRILDAYGIPTVKTIVARTVDEAAKTAVDLGFPVVLKLFSETITHKTDVGGVKLNLADESAVRAAWQSIESSVFEKAGPGHFQGVTVQQMISLSDGYEIILGSSLDSQFGPVLLFGSGGQLVEVYKDRALGLPPLNATLARRMMEQTRIYTALKGVRGRKSVDLTALEHLLVHFSYLVAEQPWIKEIDINPLLVSADRIIALDARVVLHDPDVAEADLPKLAIRPYPTNHITPFSAKNGTPMIFRPIRPEDEPLLVDFHQTLSERSIHHRWFTQVELSKRIAHERLTRICFNDYDREIALVIESCHPETKKKEVLGVGRLSKLHGHNEAEFATLISDSWQGQGLGTQMLQRLVEIGRAEKLSRISARMLADNHEMQAVAKGAGFVLKPVEGTAEVLAVITL
ncbi:MAG: bifunctional acetate--CoA ligase family protein/GNAT family N-acetyltransferase [Verrucomicrobiae bacterium]